MSEGFGNEPNGSPAGEFFTVSEDVIRREKDKARKLRDSAWWKRKRSTGICYYCGKKFPPSELTMDHVIPVSRGGRSVKENLVPCCKECNNKKKYLLPMEWTEYLESLRGGQVQSPGRGAKVSESQGEVVRSDTHSTEPLDGSEGETGSA